MREDAAAPFERISPYRPDAPAPALVVGDELLGEAEERRRHLLGRPALREQRLGSRERPADLMREVHRRGARSGYGLRRRGELGPVRRRIGQRRPRRAELGCAQSERRRPCDADSRRAAHHEAADGIHHLLPVGRAGIRLPVGQLRLVDHRRMQQPPKQPPHPMGFEHPRPRA